MPNHIYLYKQKLFKRILSSESKALIKFVILKFSMWNDIAYTTNGIVFPYPNKVVGTYTYLANTNNLNRSTKFNYIKNSRNT